MRHNKGQDRIVSLVLAVAFFVSIMVPAVTHVYAECRTTQCLLGLDDCNGMGSSVLYDSDGLFISEWPADTDSLPLTGVHKIPAASFNPFNAVFQLERPPRA